MGRVGTRLRHHHLLHHPHERGTVVSLKPVDILLVEDNPADARLVEEAFKEGEPFITLHTVGDGPSAQRFLRREEPHTDAPRPDLVILDLRLPGKDGMHLLAEIKRTPSLMRIPVVVFSDSRMEEDILNAYGLNANCYIVKPTDLDQFIGVVRSLQHFWCTVVTLPPGE